MPIRPQKPVTQPESAKTGFHAIRAIFSIQADTDYKGTIDSLRKGIEFKGFSVYTLIFAIFIASIGLNTNSTAVIIGAMLISPLMGPIMGAGLALGTYDFALLKKAGRNLFIMTVISLITSTIYFVISPLSEAQSELLARTSPTIYDVLIAVFGGATGIVAGSRKDKISNAIPGVAIATALMPPLCTAGYGLATGSLRFFAGAMYLYLINSIFIGLATFAFIRIFRFRQVTEVTHHVDKKIKRYIYLVSIFMVLPSVYFAYDLITESAFRKRANRYVLGNFNFEKSRVMSTRFTRAGGKEKIEVAIVGEPLSEEMIAHLKKQLPIFELQDSELLVIQPEKYDKNPISATMNSNFSDESRSKDEKIIMLQEEIRKLNSREKILSDLTKEIHILFTDIESVSYGDLLTGNISDLTNTTQPTLLAKWKPGARISDKKRLEQFLKIRLKIPGLVVREVRE